MFRTKVQKRNDMLDYTINDLIVEGIRLNDMGDVEGAREVELKIQYLQGLKEPVVGIDVNTVVLVAGNLAGILLILNHERLHVVSSKALGFVLKGRV